MAENIIEQNQSKINHEEKFKDSFHEWKKMIESFLFYQSKLVSIDEISSNIPEIPKNLIEEILRTLKRDYENFNGALKIYQCQIKKEKKFQLKVKNHVMRKKEIEEFTSGKPLKPLTLKTLAFIAFNQPIEKEDIITLLGKRAFNRIEILLNKKFVKKEKNEYNVLDENGEETIFKTEAYSTTNYFADTLGIENKPELFRKKLSKYM